MPDLPLTPIPPIVDAVAGSLASVLALVAIYPLDVAKTRRQIPRTPSSASHHRRHSSSNGANSYASMRVILWEVWRRDGWSGIYAGMSEGVLATAGVNFAYFYFYGAIRRAYTHLSRLRTRARCSSAGETGVAMELLLGALAGALTQLVTIPVSIVVTRKQTSDEQSTRARSMWETWRAIVAEDGVGGLWRGLGPSLVLTSNPAITYAAYQRLASRLLQQRGSKTLGAWEVFMVGAAAKSIATVVTYPYIMAKVAMQYKSSSLPRPPWSATQDYAVEDEGIALEDACRTPTHLSDVSALDILRNAWATGGILGLYRGLDAQLAKAVTTQALMMVIKQRVQTWVFLVWVWLAAARRRIMRS